MTTPIDDMSAGEATAEILRLARRLDERLDRVLAKTEIAAADAPPAAPDSEEVRRMSRLWGYLRVEVNRLHERLDALEKHVGFNPKEDLKKKLDELERTIEAAKEP